MKEKNFRFQHHRNCDFERKEFLQLSRDYDVIKNIYTSQVKVYWKEALNASAEN